MTTPWAADEAWRRAYDSWQQGSIAEMERGMKRARAMDRPMTCPCGANLILPAGALAFMVFPRPGQPCAVHLVEWGDTPKNSIFCPKRWFRPPQKKT